MKASHPEELGTLLAKKGQATSVLHWKQGQGKPAVLHSHWYSSGMQEVQPEAAEGTPGLQVACDGRPVPQDEVDSVQSYWTASTPASIPREAMAAGTSPILAQEAMVRGSRRGGPRSQREGPAGQASRAGQGSSASNIREGPPHAQPATGRSEAVSRRSWKGVGERPSALCVKACLGTPLELLRCPQTRSQELDQRVAGNKGGRGAAQTMPLLRCQATPSELRLLVRCSAANACTVRCASALGPR